MSLIFSANKVLVAYECLGQEYRYHQLDFRVCTKQGRSNLGLGRSLMKAHAECMPIAGPIAHPYFGIHCQALTLQGKVLWQIELKFS